MKAKILTSILVGILVISFISVGFVVAANGNGAGLERVPVLIGFHQVPGPSEQALVRSHGGAIKYSYTIVPAIAASIPEPAIEGLLHNPNVTYVEPDSEVYAISEVLPWGIDRIDAELVHQYNNKGDGVKVAIIDTGIDLDHPDLTVAGNVTFVAGTANGDDDAGHGTHVAGIVAALDNEIGVIGVAPKADLYAVKVLDSSGSGWMSDVVAGINWSANNGMKVINMSLGGGASSTLETACNNAWNNGLGIVLVAAAGNSGNRLGTRDTIEYPAAYASVIAVAATDQSDRRASWSSTGPDLELSAPGVSIYSTYMNGGYATMSGTSMASPHVAGVAALAIAAGVGSAKDVRDTLVSTAEDLGDPGWDTKYGYGLVNADEAAGVPGVDVHDVAVVDIIAPALVIQGDTATIGVSVKNEGTVTEVFNVELFDLTLPGNMIGTQLVNLISGATSTVYFDWYTGSASLGDHLIEGVAESVTGESDTADNSMTAQVTVTETTGEFVMYVADIVMALKKAGPNVNAVATITVVDGAGIPVAGATVSGQWSGLTSDSDVGTTDTSGGITLQSNKIKNPVGTFTFTVDSVVKSGWTYIPEDDDWALVIVP
jgi:subtilisin family serine protease